MFLNLNLFSLLLFFVNLINHLIRFFEFLNLILHLFSRIMFSFLFNVRNIRIFLIMKITLFKTAEFRFKFILSLIFFLITFLYLIKYFIVVLHVDCYWWSRNYFERFFVLIFNWLLSLIIKIIHFLSGFINILLIIIYLCYYTLLIL